MTFVGSVPHVRQDNEHTRDMEEFHLKKQNHKRKESDT